MGSSNKPVSRKKHYLRTVIIIIAALFVLNCWETYLMTPLFIVKPQYNEAAAKKLLSDNTVQEIVIEGSYELSGYLLDREEANRLIIFFGGREEDAAESMLLLMEMADTGDGEILKSYDFASVDWPQYGKSKGEASAEAMRGAAELVVRHFNTEFQYEEIVLMGYSLGTGPAVYAASVCNCDKLILVAPYASAVDLFNTVVPVFYGPFRLLAGYRMPVTEYAEKVKADTLVVACRNDTRVPFSSTEELIKHFNNKHILAEVSGISHGMLPASAYCISAVCGFLE